MCVSQASTSSDSLDGPCVDYAKSYDAVVFDVLKVTPEEFAVSMIRMLPQSIYGVQKEVTSHIRFHLIYTGTSFWQTFYLC